MAKNVAVAGPDPDDEDPFDFEEIVTERTIFTNQPTGSSTTHSPSDDESEFESEEIVSEHTVDPKDNMASDEYES